MVETIRLESGHTLTGIVGSNPTLSASPFIMCHLQAGDTDTETGPVDHNSNPEPELSTLRRQILINDGESGFCVHSWLRGQQHQKIR